MSVPYHNNMHVLDLNKKKQDDKRKAKALAMERIPDRTCCFVVPLRFGVITIATIQLLIAGGFIAVAFIYAHGFIYACLMVFSIFGLIGASMQYRKLIQIYFAAILGQLFFSMGSAGLNIALLFSSQPSAEYQKCNSSGLDPFSLAFCKRDGLIRGTAPIAFALVWGFEIYGLFIANYYSRHLLDVEADEENNFAKASYI